MFNVPGEIHQVFYQKALDCNASLFLADKNIKQYYNSDLKGSYQLKNIKTAVQVVSLLNDINFDISESSISKGLLKVVENTGLLGRWQILSSNPLIICDTAHNPNGLKYVLEQISTQEYETLHIVLGVVGDKDLGNILPMFPKNAIYYFCKPNIPNRATSQSSIQIMAPRCQGRPPCHQAQFALTDIHQRCALGPVSPDDRASGDIAGPSVTETNRPLDC